MRSNITISDPYIYCDVSVLFLLLNIGILPKLKFQWVPNHNIPGWQNPGRNSSIIKPGCIYFYPMLIYRFLFLFYQFAECINTDFLYQELNPRFVPAGAFTMTVKHT